MGMIYNTSNTDFFLLPVSACVGDYNKKHLIKIETSWSVFPFFHSYCRQPTISRVCGTFCILTY